VANLCTERAAGVAAPEKFWPSGVPTRSGEASCAEARIHPEVLAQAVDQLNILQ
jgi:hypothetical protein